MLKIILLSIVFLTPLVGPVGNLGYEEAKVLFFILAVSLAALVWLKSGVDRIKRTDRTEIKKTALLFILVLGVTALLGINPQVSFLGAEPYFQGVILYAYLLLFFLIVSSVKIKLEDYAKVLSLAGLVVGGLAIKDFLGLKILGWELPLYAGRVVSSFGQPNFYAGFLLLVLPFSFFLGGRLGKLGILGEVAGILISGSRSGLILMVFVLVGGFLGRSKNTLFFIVGLAVFLSAIGGAVYFSKRLESGLIWKEITEPQKLRDDAFADAAGPVEKRFYLWPVFWELINRRPFLGYGLENIATSYSQYFEINKYTFFEANAKQSSVLLRLKDLAVDRTHNYPLDILMFSGIMGFLSWGILVCFLVRQAKNSVLFVSLILYLLWVQFQNQSVVQLIYFWLLAGLINLREQGQV